MLIPTKHSGYQADGIRLYHGGKGGSSAPPPDPRLVEGQLKSMGIQDDMIKQIMANSAEMAPLQKAQMQFGLDSAKTAYGQSQDDRSWSIGRRGALQGLQDTQIAEAKNFNTAERANELAAQAGADVNQGFASAREQSGRAMARMGINPNSGRSQAAGKRAQAEFDSQASVRQLAATVATLQLGLANTDDPVQQQAIQAKLAAIQSGLGGDKNAPSEVKLASAMLKAGMAPDMRSALEMAVTRKSNSPDEIHQGFVAAGLKNMTLAAQSVKAADEVMTSMGFAKKNGRWTQGQGDGGAPSGPAKGAVLNGFEFQGGNPNDKKSWRSVAVGKVN